MAAASSLVSASALAFSFAVAALIFFLCPPATSSSFPQLPFLKPLASGDCVQDVCVFVLCTSAIAIIIYSNSQSGNGESKKKEMQVEHLEQFYSHVASIFEDSSVVLSEEPWGMAHETFPSGLVKDQEFMTMEKADLLNEQDTGADATLFPTCLKLHRSSSSVDDTVDDKSVSLECVETKPETSPNGNANDKEAVQVETKKPIRKVSFYIQQAGQDKDNVPASSSSSSISHISSVSPSPSPSACTGVSPSAGEAIDRQADAFIAKFKERIRMQRLESFQRLRRKFTH